MLFRSLRCFKPCTVKPTANFSPTIFIRTTMTSDLTKTEDDLTADFLEVVDSSVSARKQRKPQSEEDFQKQKEQFHREGPVLQDKDWLFNIKQFNPASKVDRGYLKNAAERAYYLKDYQKALEMLEQTKDWNLSGREKQEFETIRQHCFDKMDEHTNEHSNEH